MSRKTKTITIEADNRDKGKRFVITEMSAIQAERWAIRALMAVGRNGINIPDNVQSLGFAVMAKLGLEALMRADSGEVLVLLDELMTCIVCTPDPRNSQVQMPWEEAVEEVSTILRLRKEVFGLHADFFINAVS